MCIFVIHKTFDAALTAHLQLTLFGRIFINLGFAVSARGVHSWRGAALLDLMLLQCWPCFGHGVD